MLVSQINLFSLLIPLFMLVLAGLIIILRAIHKIPVYFMWYSLALCLNASALIIFNIFAPTLVTQLNFIPTLILLVGFLITIHSIHLRFKLKTKWLYSFLILTVTSLHLCHYTFHDENYLIRMLGLAVCTCFLFTQRIVQIWRLNLKHRFDQSLRTFIFIILGITLLRTIILFFVIDHHTQLLTNQVVLASTQLIIFLCIIAIAILLYGATYQDILARLYQERSTDPLTGLWNRRAIYEHVSEIKTASHYQHAIILCDIDHFKKINDLYGHHVGDLALKHTSKLLSYKLRHHDRISRLGGEEFLIILEDTSKTTAIHIAERLRKTIEDHPLSYQGMQIQLSVSFGVTTFTHEQEFKHVLQLCDSLLYQAKKLGRNKVEWQLQS